MHRSPRIKPTLINGVDANPKVMESRHTERAIIGDWDGPACLGLGRLTPLSDRWAPPSVGCLLVSSRLFLT
jgi:hypothetical protein